MLPQWIIENKRDGQRLTPEQIRFLVNGYAQGSIPDYQMAAFAMAVFFRGMDFDEIATLTDSMMRSGDTLDLSCLPGPTVDKHSSGGIGDKVSLPLAPMVAACGAYVPMLSGRGLGITGGTLDKLESIPGYNTHLSAPEFIRTVATCGCSITGQTETMVPADRKLYALRDVTGTVPSIPLITSSIMSKKLAEGAQSLVLDVKFGSGAFMKTLEDATTLAQTMVEVGSRMNRNMIALLTDMNQPTGHTVGNALEVREAIELLRGNGPPDLLAITLELGANMLLLTQRAANLPDARRQLLTAIESGRALQTFIRMAELHGADLATLDNPDRLPTAPIRHVLTAPASGFILQVDAGTIGRAALLLGAGRTRTDESVNPAVGIADILKTGNPVQTGDRLMTLHAASTATLQIALAQLQNAVTIGPNPPPPIPTIARTVLPATRSTP